METDKNKSISHSDRYNNNEAYNCLLIKASKGHYERSIAKDKSLEKNKETRYTLLGYKQHRITIMSPHSRKRKCSTVS